MATTAHKKPTSVGRGKTRSKIAPPKRRAVNLDDTGGVVTPAEQHARNYLDANAAKNAQSKIEKNEFQSCWQSMAHSDKARMEFTWGPDDKMYVAEIAGADKTEVDSTALYQMMQNKEITEEQFLNSISCTQARVKSACGTNALMKISTVTPQEAKLTIKVKK